MAAEKTSIELFQVEHIHPPPSESPVHYEWTEQEERAVRRKLDYRLVPIATLLYLLCFLDRANIGNARIQGMKDDLHLVGYRFNWALTVFYLVYILVEIPSNVVLKQIGPRFWIPFLVGGFGLVSMCTAFVRTFQELCVARAFLGLFEGGTMPGIAFLLSSFYKRQELLLRIGTFVSAASIAGAFGGLLAAGLSRVPQWGTTGVQIKTWRNIFFFEGISTMIVAALTPLILPSKPEKCKFLTDRERYIATERLFQEHRSNPDEIVNAVHMKRAIFNINNVICAAGFFLLNITVQSVSLFLPTILNDLGWTSTKAQLYSVPPYIVACVVAICVAYISDKTRRRGIYLAIFSFISIAGFAVLRSERDPNLKYMAVFFAVAGAFPGGPGFLSWGLNNAAGPAVRTVSSAYIVSVGTFGSVVATWTYVPKDAPLYLTGHSINLGAQAGVFVVACLGMAYCTYENNMRSKGRRDHRLTEESAESLGYRHPQFKYIP